MGSLGSVQSYNKTNSVAYLARVPSSSIEVEVHPREDGRYVAEKASADHVGVATEVASSVRVRAPPALRSTSEGGPQFHDSQPEDHFKVSFGNPAIVETWRHGQKFTKFSRRTW